MSEKRVPPSAEEFEKLLAERILSGPSDVISASEPWLPTDKIPGFEKLTFGASTVYEITWQMIAALRDAKAKCFQATIVPTAVGLHIVRGFTRLEWSGIQREIAETAESVAKSHMEAKVNANWADKDIEMRTEELIALKATVLPLYDKELLRAKPAGIAGQLADAILEASSLTGGNQLPPMRL